MVARVIVADTSKTEPATSAVCGSLGARRPPSPPPVPPGSDLPRDVLGAILAHLRDPRDVAVAAAACKDWAAVVAGDARLRASFPTSGRAGTEGEPVAEGEPAGRPRLWVL